MDMRVLSSAAFVLVVTQALATAAQPAPQEASRPVTYRRDVAPILQRHCVSCHRPGQAAPFALQTFDQVRLRARLIAAVAASRVMPPWQPDGPHGVFTGDRRLADADIRTLARWVDEGLVEGPEAEGLPGPSWSDGWQLGEPDLVVPMSEPFDVPAEGPDVFRNVVLPVPMGERQFVRALEFRPGNPRVLHHARVLVDGSGEMRQRDAEEPGVGFGGMEAPGAVFPDGHFLGWAPGKTPAFDPFPWPLDPGTDLVVQMHLKPTGRPERVQASIGLYFAEAAPTHTPVMLRLGTKTIDIPAGEARYEIEDTLVLPVDATILSVYPHAHYLATEMSVTTAQPGRAPASLLHIARWDFNWQDEYSLASPRLVPRGTAITMRYRYDNSAANPRNPSTPPRRVRFGPETRDEMGELLVQVVTRTPADAAALQAFVRRRTLLADVAGEEKRLADVPGDTTTRNALGVAYIQLGRTREAVRQFEATLRVDPAHATAHYNLGVIAMAENRAADAERHLRAALASRPAYAEAHNNLGVVLEASGRSGEAEAEYRAALAVRPAHTGAHNNLGRLLLARAALVEAEAEFGAALRARPDSADALYNLGRVFVAAGRPEKAVEPWRRAVALRPDSLTFVLDLAWTLATTPAVADAPEALRLAEEAVRSTRGTNPVALDVLAAAYAADRQWATAVRTARRALERAVALGNTALAADIRERLDRYQAGAASAGTPAFS